MGCRGTHWIRIIIAIGCCTVSCFCFAAASIEGIKVYQKNMHLFPDRKESLAADIYRYHNADNIWDALRSEFALPHYENNPLVQEQIEWFMNHQDFLQRSSMRAAPYLYYIFQQVKKRHLPAELVLIPIIESAYNPFAYSTAGAAGIWQMMPGTASGYGIKQNWWYDGRRDVVASTHAALNHLLYLSTFFQGNWLLAIAAYDTGEGNVQSAIQRNIMRGENVDFWSLPVAQETREYVPRLLALACIISNPERYPIDFPAVHNAPYLAQVDVGAQIDLKHAAYLAGMSLQTLKHLNSGYNRPTTDPAGPFKLVLPIENVQQFTENLAQSARYHRFNWVRYKVKSGDTLLSVARHFNITTASLYQHNPSLSSHLKTGMNLLIPRSVPAISRSLLESKQEQLVATATPPLSIKSRKKIFAKNASLDINVSRAFENYHGNYAMQPGDTLYMVRRGDDLKKIAHHFHIHPNLLVSVNHLVAPRSLKPGKYLMIPTHLNHNSSQHYQLTPGDTIYVVRYGDTLEKIAAKFHTSPREIRLANLLSNPRLLENDRLVIPTHS